MSKTRNLITGTALAVTIIIGSVLGIEGGYSDHSKDTGGKTMFGITEQVARSNGYTGNMLELPETKAKDIYVKDYVIVPNYDMIVQVSEAVGHKLIDTGVNVGTYRSSLWFQKALNSFNRNELDYKMITEDGVIGPATVSAYKALETVRGKAKACSLIIKALDIQQGYHYLSLTNHRDFTVGWIDKRIQNVPVEKCSS